MTTNNAINSGNLYSAGNGFLLIGQTTGQALPAALTAGAGISIVNGTNSITIATTGEGNFTNVTGSTVALAAGGIYMDNYTGGQLTATLPTTAAVGDTYTMIGSPNAGSTGWKIAQNASQTISFGGSTTTSGTGGSLASTLVTDKITIRCTTANTGFVAYDAQGNITVV